jgi:hypothetical protein
MGSMTSRGANTPPHLGGPLLYVARFVPIIDYKPILALLKFLLEM